MTGLTTKIVVASVLHKKLRVFAENWLKIEEGGFVSVYGIRKKVFLFFLSAQVFTCAFGRKK
jgi:hypothetical protein